MSDDLVKPDVCVCDEEVAGAIADWGKKSIAAKESLAIAVGFLESLFRDRMHMVKNKSELKFHLRASLSAEKQAVLTFTDAFVRSKGQSPEQKAQILERAKIGKEINKMYLELLNATFPVDDDVVLPTSGSKKPPSTPNTPMGLPEAPVTPPATWVQYDPSDQFDQLAAHLIANYDPSAPPPPGVLESMKSSTVSMKSSTAFPKMTDMESAIDEVQPNQIKKTRAKTDKSKAVGTGPIDVPMEVTLALGDNLKKMVKSGIPVLVPSGGTLASVLREQGVNVVTTITEAQAIVAFPPAHRKWVHLPQYMATGFPYFVLLPLTDATSKEWHSLFGDSRFDLNIINGKCLFLEGDRIRVGESYGWFMFYPDATGKMTLVHIGDVDDVELGDEDSVDGRGYDTDEKECEDLDNAILNDPNSKFTKDGYLVDSLTIGDDEDL